MLDRLCIAVLALFVTHQIDAAYWREWQMFHLPGGIQLFNVLNLLLFLVLLAGLRSVFLRRPGGYYWALLIAFSGIATFFIHGGFMLAGYDQFLLPVSVLVIAAFFLASLWLVSVTLRSGAGFGAHPPRRDRHD